MPRLKRLEPHQADDQARRMMADLEKNKRLLNVFRGMANSPAVLDGYLKFSAALRDGKLDARTRAAISLAVAQSNRCDYCLSAHTFMGKAAGLADAEICDARQGRCGDAKSQAAVTLARKLTECKGVVGDADVSAARQGGLDDAEIAEVVANVALNIFTNYFNHVNQTEVDLPEKVRAAD
jgi:AhpD family alkylhydroperoxidase